MGCLQAFLFYGFRGKIQVQNKKTIFFLLREEENVLFCSCFSFFQLRIGF